MPYCTALNFRMYGGAGILAQYNYWQKKKDLVDVAMLIMNAGTPRTSKFSMPRRGLYDIIVIGWSTNPNGKHQPKFGGMVDESMETTREQ